MSANFLQVHGSIFQLVFDIVSWFYREAGGTAGVFLFCLGVAASYFWLVAWQCRRQGTAAVVKVYLIGIVTAAGVYFGIPGTPQGTSQISYAQSVFPSDRQKLDSLTARLNERQLLGVQQQQSPEEEDWAHRVGIPLLCWAFAAGVVIYVVRTHPEAFSFGNLKRLLNSKDWIRPSRSKNNELGSSDFATPKQVKRWTEPHGKYDTKLFVDDVRGSTGIMLKHAELIIPVGERNRHMLIIAKTGGGKTTKMILPILYNDCMCPHRSTIVIDSKAEMWVKLAGLTKKYNPHKQVVLFNPLDRVRSLSWNILAKVETDTDCKLIANSVIMATDEPAAKQDSPFFRNSALQVLNAMMVGLLHDPNDRLSMPRIHELINLGMLKLCDWLDAHPVAARTTKTFIELARSGSQNADTIMSELSMRIQAWDLSAIRATTYYDEIDIETVIKQPTLFVVELRESELKMLRPLANVVVVEMLRYLTKYAEECPGQTLPRPVSLVCDEFASALGRLPDIHIKLNTLRSRNVSIIAAIQSIGQIKGNYGEDWESVISGFSTKIFMPTLDYMDSEWASKESGIMTVRYRTSSRGQNRKIIENFANRNTGSNEYVQQRQVLTPAEIGRPVDNQATFFLPETPVFQGHLVAFYKMPMMKKAFDEFNEPATEVKLRETPIELEEKLPDPVCHDENEQGGGGHDTNYSDEQLWAALEELKVKYLDWENTVGDARQWWLAFEEENKAKIALVLKVAQEIQKRGATITDFFLAYVYSNTDNIQATLAYLDYTMQMKAAEGAAA